MAEVGADDEEVGGFGEIGREEAMDRRMGEWKNGRVCEWMTDVCLQHEKTRGEEGKDGE
jgi:hypothetical protein